jgi:hypothetical protein
MICAHFRKQYIHSNWWLQLHVTLSALRETSSTSPANSVQPTAEVTSRSGLAVTQLPYVGLLSMLALLAYSGNSGHNAIVQQCKVVHCHHCCQCARLSPLHHCCQCRQCHHCSLLSPWSPLTVHSGPGDNNNPVVQFPVFPEGGAAKRSLTHLL